MVHDYQLALVPGMVRAARPDLALAPLHPHAVLRPQLDPCAAVRRRRVDLCRSMASVPSGFHTTRWAQRLRGVGARRCSGSRRRSPPLRDPARARPRRARRRLRGGSVGGAPPSSTTWSATASCILRTDRIDPSKNIVRGFLAYDQLLAQHPEWRERVVFVAHAQPSRENAGRVPRVRAGGRAGRGACERPLGDAPTGSRSCSTTRDDYERSVAGFRRYDVLLVNPVKDGLNLVAKEGPLRERARRRAVPVARGGCVRRARDAAVAVHPYDIVAVGRRLARSAGDARRRARRARTAAARARRACTRRGAGSPSCSRTRR